MGSWRSAQHDRNARHGHWTVDNDALAFALGRAVLYNYALMGVAVASRFGADVQGSADFGNQGFVVGDEGCDALGLGAYSQQRLLKFQVQRHFCRYLEGKRRRIFHWDLRILLSTERQELFVQMQELFARGLGGVTAPFIIEKAHLGAQEGTLLVHPQDFKAAQALGEDIEPAIVVAFDYIENPGGAANLGHLFLLCMDNAEYRVFFQAFTDHLFIARLKDMQRQRYGGKQDQRQREDGQQNRHIDIVPLTPDPFREYKARG